jgi:hypothetical protein
MHGKVEKFIGQLIIENQKERDHMGDLDIDG